MRPQFLTPLALEYAKKEYGFSREDVIALYENEDRTEYDRILDELLWVEVEEVHNDSEGTLKSERLRAVGDLITALTDDPPLDEENEEFND